jgi:acetylornithine deacetylase/succinyl-diaminopimelate desuccinylase-like protein
VLIYGHYDVQPPDPMELWTSPPFEPVIKKTKFIQAQFCSRCDAMIKGQMYMHVKSILNEYMIADCLPCNVKFMIEGEEEVGSKV